MKIYLDARVIIDKQTGIGNYTYNLLKHILEIDHENEYTVLVNRSLSRNHPIMELEQKNLKRKLVAIREVSPQQQFLIWAPLLKEKPDVYHYPNFDLPIFQPCNSVFTVHDLTYLRHRSLYLDGRWLKNYYTKYIMILGAKKAQKIIAVSRSTKQDLIDLLHVPEEKIVVIYEAVDDSYLDNKLFESNKNLQQKTSEQNQDEKYFLFLGERRPHKNIVRIIEAFARFKAKTSGDYKLVIGGKPYSSYREPEKRAAELGLSESVVFRGYVAESELQTLYKNAAGFVFTSIYEGFGIPILEAMACGTPVITSNLSSMPEVAGRAALIVDPYDVAAITGAMETIASDWNLRQRLIKNGREQVKLFSWKSSAEQTVKVYESIYNAAQK